MISALMILIAILGFQLLPNSMNVLVVALIFTILSTKYKKIFSKSYILYIIAFAIAVLSIVFYLEPYFRYVINGVIGYGIFLVVMFVGALPNKWGVSRSIKKVRGELSILGFLFISPHAFLRVFGIWGSIDLFGIAAFVIMIPLILTSVKFIKKEIPPRDWLRIQKGAYGIYLLLFVHLLVVASWDNKVIYAVLLTLYLNNKILKEVKRRKR